MLAIARFSIPLASCESFHFELESVKNLLAQTPGFIDAQIGKNLDDPTLWVLYTRWENVGSYRRAISSNRIKLEAVPILARAIDEPGAYE